MPWAGRAPLSPILPRLLPSLLYVIQLASTTDYGVPIEIQLWDTGRTPLAHMVDVTNGFGLKVLAEHNFLNDNNIAFSPYGLTGIMVALCEGVDGESSYQILRGMELPWTRNVMRIGFRDIHRTLKTYFVPEEGFLAGLALNNENVTFTDKYKEILRFYGFDLDKEQIPTLPPSENTENQTTTPMTTQKDPTTESGKEETTANPNAETINEIDIREPTTVSTTPGATDAASNAGEVAPTTSSPAEQAATEATMETSPLTTQPPESAPAIQNDADPAVTADTSVAPTTTTEEPTANNVVETTTTAQTTDQNIQTRIDDIASAEQSTSTTSMPEAMEEQTTTTPKTETMDTTIAVTDATIETLERKKKSIVDFIFTNPPYVDDYLVYRSYSIPTEPVNNINDERMFLVNGLRNVAVTYMKYDTILEHAYLPHLEASALRLPLDSERYYLLVVLPSRGGIPDLGRLIARMARESDLRDVYSALRPRRVRAIVPSFTVKGHITLTTDLQKLGIRDVFEPRQRDFTPMTPQSGVYVRSVEQAVSVAIRKYRPDSDTRYVAGYTASHQQAVRFSATYPFLYFVMDASIHVALMAGKMVDPLNSRIL